MANVYTDNYIIQVQEPSGSNNEINITEQISNITITEYGTPVYVEHPTASYVAFSSVDGLPQFSSSISNRVYNLESFSSSLDATFATDAQLNQLSSSLNQTVSSVSQSLYQFTTVYNTGSFTGSFIGDGSQLQNIPASGIIGLNLSQIQSGSVSASISPASGFRVNTDSIFNGSVTANSFSGSLFGTASYVNITGLGGVLGTGSAGQVAYFNGTSIVTGGNLLFDNTGKTIYFNGGTGNIGYTNNSRTITFNDGNSGILYQAFGGHRFTVWNQSTYLNAIVATGNTSTPNVGIFVDAPSARLHIRGSGTTSSTTALLVQNSSAEEILTGRDDGQIFMRPNRLFNTDQIKGRSGPFSIEPFNSASYIRILTAIGATNAIIIGNVNNEAATSGNRTYLTFDDNFTPTSGTALRTWLSIPPTINQTGGANGITRGLYVNPTLTAAADWRSIEFSNNTGWGLYGSGSAPNFLSGSLTLANGLTVTGSITATSYTASSALITGDVVVGGRVTAQEFYTEFVSSSIIYESGSTKFGDSLDDIHQVTGSLRVTGSGDHFIVGGNVGIGTNLPSYRLDVSGSGNFTDKLILSSSIEMQLGSGRSGIIERSGNAIQIRNSATGTHVRYNDSNRTDHLQVNYFSNGVDITPGGNSTNFGLVITSGSYPAATLLRAGVNTLVVTGSNVGIGTLTPGYALDIQTTGTSGINVQSGGSGIRLLTNAGLGNPGIQSTGIIHIASPINGTGGTEVLQVRKAANANFIQYWANNSGTTLSTIDGNGNFGIGFQSSPSASLHVSGSSNSSLFRIDSPAANNIIFVSGSGNVGIGTNIPQDKLHVRGGVTLRRTDDIDMFSINNAAGIIGINEGNSGIPTFRIRSQNNTFLFQIKASEDRIGINTNSAHSSSILDITSTNRGFLPPRMTTSQRDAISSPAQGLMLYVTSSADEGLYYYNSGSYQGWTKVLNNSGSQFITGSINILGTLTISGSQFQYSDNTDVDTGTETVVSIATGSYRSAFFDYIIASGSNARAGTVFSVWGGASIEFTETSTNDIGTTTDVTLSTILTGSNVELRATTLSNNWTVKSLVRML